MRKHEVELVGQEVSCRVLEILFAALAEKGLPPESLTEGVDYPPEYLLDKHRRIDWASFRKVMCHAGRIWSDEELIELGQVTRISPPLRPFWLVSGAMFSVEGVYYHLLEPQWGGARLLYTCMQSTIQKIGSNHLVLERTVAEGYLAVREHFLLLKGALIAIPITKGLEAAVVEMEEIEGGARYQIWLPEEKGLLPWLRRVVTWPFMMRTLVQELREALAALHEQYTALQAEMARREQVEAQLRYQADLLAHINDAVVATDERFIVTAWNRAAERIYDRTAEEALGRPVNEVIHSEITDEGRSEARRLLAEIGRHSAEMSVYHRNGRALYVQGITIALYNEAGEIKGYVAVNRDITKRKQAEAALKASEAKYRTLIEQMPAVMYQAALDDVGTKIYISPQIEQITGYPPEMWTDKPGFFAEAVHPDDRAQVLATANEIQARGEPLRVKYRLLTQEGREVWFQDEAVMVKDEAGQPVYVQGIMLDITDRKQAKKALAEQERRYQTLVELVPVGIYRTDRTWQTIYVNQRYTEITGLTADQIQDYQRWSQFIVPDDRDRVMTSWFQAVEQNLPFEIEFSVRRPDGSVVWVITRGVPEYNEEEKLTGYVGIVVDLTERKQAEKALAESQRRFQALFDQSLDAILLFDDQINFVDANPATCVLLGYSREELAQMNVSNLTPQVKQDQIEPLRQEFLAATQLSGEYTLVSKDGAIIEVEYRATAHVIPGLHMVALRDITERKRLEQEIRESWNQFRAILDTVPDYVVMVERDGTITFANRSHPSLAMADIIGTNYIDWAPAASRQTFRAVLEQATKTGEPQAFEIWSQGLEGTRKWYLNRVGPVKEEDEVVGLTIVSTDMTERKQVEQERERLISELEAKNAELERFTYTVSHDLKSPLITIKGFLGHLERDARAGNRKRLEADIKYIREATETMGQLLDDLLELSRVGRMVNPSQMVSLSELAGEAITLLAGQIAARQVQIDVSPELPVVWGDRPRLLEVLQNLIDNAIKYTDNQAKPRVEIGVRPAGEERVCYVLDNGIGIEPRYQDKIFDLFEQLDPNGEGTGIGLALVKRIIELHGGRIWVESKGKGQGSMFCFTLPEGD